MVSQDNDENTPNFNSQKPKVISLLNRLRINCNNDQANNIKKEIISEEFEINISNNINNGNSHLDEQDKENASQEENILVEEEEDVEEEIRVIGTEEEDVEEEIRVIGTDEEIEEDENCEYEVIEIDEDDFEQCVLMPYKDKIKTRPVIKIEKNFEFYEKRLFVPESKCAQTLDERFNELQSKMLKYTINPIFGIGGLSTFCFDNGDGSYQVAPVSKNRRSAFTRLGYFFKKPKPVSKVQCLVASKIKKRSLKYLTDTKSHIEKQHSYWKNKFKWSDREPKSKEELDEEIDDYMAKRGLEEEEDDDDELDDFDEDLEDPMCNPEVIEKILDKELEEYMKQSKTSKTALDKDIDNYMIKRNKIAKDKLLNDSIKKSPEHLETVHEDEIDMDTA